MSDRDRYGLRGSIKRCELHRTWYSRGCGPETCETEERSDVSVVEFRRDGFVQRRWYKNPAPNSTEWTNLYDYNDANQLTAVRIEQGGTIRIQQTFEYDSRGRLSHIIVHDEDGGQRIGETYSYDDAGTKKKITHIEPQLSSGSCGTDSCGTMFGVEGSDVAYGAPGATNITSIYDERGRPTEHRFRDSGGNLVTRVDCRYDERGNLLEEVCSQQKLPPEMIVAMSPEQLEAVRMLFTSRQHHQYDEQNQRIETSSYMGPKDFDRETFAYNEHGDVISQISESSHSEYDFGEDGILTPKPDSTRSNRSEAQFRYQYDSLGNWIEKIVENPGGPIWSIERRTISYF
jgi:YD repeat-containing protein